MVILTRRRSAENGPESLVDVTAEQLDCLHEEGVLLRYDLAKLGLPNWHGFLVFRERSESVVLVICSSYFHLPTLITRLFQSRPDPLLSGI
jgi:hypothetical protein